MPDAVHWPPQQSAPGHSGPGRGLLVEVPAQRDKVRGARRGYEVPKDGHAAGADAGVIPADGAAGDDA